jgi:hypothetical protein
VKHWTDDALAAMRAGDVLNTYEDLQAALVAAKAAARDGGDKRAREKLRDAKERLDEFRTWWRTVDAVAHAGQPGARQLHPFVGTAGATDAQEG